MSAPRITPTDLDNAIESRTFVLLPDNRTTICMLTLDNGFTVRGESSCVCIENFDAQLGMQYAEEDARRKLWPLLGFRLADRLMEARAAGPRYRDAITGAFVTEEYALLNPSTTAREA